MQKFFLILVATLFIKEASHAEKYLPENFSDALVLKASEGNAKAEYDLGLYYLTVWEITPEELKEFKTLVAKDQTKPGMAIKSGSFETDKMRENRETRIRKALNLIEQSANKGFLEAEKKLGNLYYFGFGDNIKIDYKKAAAFNLQAAIQGDIDSMVILSRTYKEGNGVPKNLKKAYFWNSKIHDQKKIELQNKERIEKYNQNKQEGLIKNLKKILRNKTEIDGSIFVQNDQVGKASYHFNLKDGSFINYEGWQEEMKLDDGSKVPAKVFFHEEQYDPKNKTFTGYIVLPSTYKNTQIAKYTVRFDDKITRIIGGYIQTFGSSGGVVDSGILTNFGTDSRNSLVYNRISQSSTNPQ